MFCSALIFANWCHVQTVRFYDVATNEQRSKYDHRAAVLACCFSDGNHAYSGGLDTSVREYVWMAINVCTPQLKHIRVLGSTYKPRGSTTLVNIMMPSRP